MHTSILKLTLLSFGAMGTMLAYQNCANNAAVSFKAAPTLGELHQASSDPIFAEPSEEASSSGEVGNDVGGGGSSSGTSGAASTPPASGSGDSSSGGLAPVVPPTATGPVMCASFQTIQGSCLAINSGFVGYIYYFLDKSAFSTNSPAYLYDKNDQAIPFDGASIGSVNVVIDRGYRAASYMVASELAMPVQDFVDGFKTGPGTYLTDFNGRKVIEGFALDLKGRLKLAPEMAEGNYELGILSDDGSLVDVDTDGDNVLESIINIDGYQAARFGCSTKALPMIRASRLPIRVRYYQGPRTEIALTLVMRKLQPGESVGRDRLCGVSYSGNSLWFSSTGTSENSRPVLSNEMTQRGWFIPGSNMIDLPLSL